MRRGYTRFNPTCKIKDDYLSTTRLGTPIFPPTTRIGYSTQARVSGYSAIRLTKASNCKPAMLEQVLYFSMTTLTTLEELVA